MRVQSRLYNNLRHRLLSTRDCVASDASESVSSDENDCWTEPPDAGLHGARVQLAPPTTKGHHTSIVNGHRFAWRRIGSH